MLRDIHENMYAKALSRLKSRIVRVNNIEEIKAAADSGCFAEGMWCGCRECEDKLKQELQVTTRNMPFDQTPVGDKCAVCGKPASKRIIFGRSY